MSGFNNPIIGGGGTLVYPAIKSPNFVDSVSGWMISKDGSAEFNNLEVRGTFLGTDYIINSDGAFFYSGTPAAAGNLIVSIASTGGSDQFGNAYQAGVAAYGPFSLFAQLAQGQLALGSQAAATRITVPAVAEVGDATSDSAAPFLLLQAPQTAAAVKPRIFLIGESKDATAPALLLSQSPQTVITVSGTSPSTSALLEVQGTGQFSGVLTPGAGTNGSGSAPQLAPGLAVGTASQLSDTTRDYMVYLTVGTPGTGVQVKIGPNNPPVRNVYGSATPTAGQQIVFRLPAGFWAEVTGSGTTLAAQNAIGC